MNTNQEFTWRNALRKLGGPVEPQHDLWPQIHDRIAALPARRARWPRFAAAAALLAACGTGMLVWHAHQDTADTPDTARTALDWSQPANPKLAVAAQDLDNASAQLQQALEAHPDAVFLVGLLNRTNSQRMRLLQATYAG